MTVMNMLPILSVNSDFPSYKIGKMKPQSFQGDSGLPCRGLLGFLNNDVLNLIFKMLTKDAARKASQTCKHFHDLIIPLLYHTVDLSLDPLIDLYHVNPYHWPPNVKDVLVRQLRFARQVTCKPEYASFVRSFSCTINMEDDGHLGLIAGELWSNPLIFSIFDKLDKATNIKINAGGRRLKTEPQLDSLFPSAQHIRLEGPMQYAFLTSILNGRDKALLQSLALQNVFEPWEDSWNEREHSGQALIGPIRGLLTTSLQERCQNLQHLCLQKQGQTHPNDHFSKHHHAFDLEVYDLWAAFIRSVRPRTLVIGHLGALHRPYQPNGPIYVPPRPEMSPMDENFQQRLLPLLKEGWVNLQRLVVRGVRRSVLGELELLEGVDVELDETVASCWESYMWRS